MNINANLPTIVDFIDAGEVESFVHLIQPIIPRIKAIPIGYNSDGDFQAIIYTSKTKAFRDMYEANEARIKAYEEGTATIIHMEDGTEPDAEDGAPQIDLFLDDDQETESSGDMITTAESDIGS